MEGAKQAPLDIAASHPSSTHRSARMSSECTSKEEEEEWGRRKKGLGRERRQVAGKKGGRGGGSRDKEGLCYVR